MVLDSPQVWIRFPCILCNYKARKIILKLCYIKHIPCILEFQGARHCEGAHHNSARLILRTYTIFIWDKMVQCSEGVRGTNEYLHSTILRPSDLLWPFMGWQGHVWQKDNLSFGTLMSTQPWSTGKVTTEQTRVRSNLAKLRGKGL